MVAASLPLNHGHSGYFSVEAIWEFFLEHTELLAVIVVIFAVLFYQQREAEHIQRVIDAPRPSDFIYVDYFALDNDSDVRFRYVPMKVVEVTESGVRLKVGNIAHSTPVSPREHVKFDKPVSVKNYYRQAEMTMSFEELRQLHNSGVIYNARRPSNMYIDGWIVIPKSEVYVDPNS